MGRRSLAGLPREPGALWWFLQPWRGEIEFSPLCGMLFIYESAASVNPEFNFLTVPAGAAVVSSRYTTTEPAGG